ncbi:hypothetical protein [Rubellicoccus peritrichatus]|uniref:Uncharacterized protein n=1 Tax=Rubellicoccus peritrichatus TaxID=3080537 RepID=A0AAQ3L9C1_9BACT|nr:hypothetical protein [Puniceicoccus sp. CR14]WOO42014.1 hypothetical protein RZN69_02860 [Puniceicoccus sp. CR14]
MSASVPSLPGSLRQARGVLEVELPDFSNIDLVRSSPEPFALWPIGDQGLVFHWLDYAINEGYSQITFRVSDRPADIRDALSHASLWPIEWKVLAVADVGEFVHYGLPGKDVAGGLPSDGWTLLDFWLELERQWLSEINKENGDLVEHLAVGRYCMIHSEAKLRMPVLIGDHVFIGPGCVVGPNCVIEEGSMLAGHSEVSNAHILAHTFLGPVTSIQYGILGGSELFDLKHRVHHQRLEGHLAESFEHKGNIKPPIWERIYALRLYFKLRHHLRNASIEGKTEFINGLMLPKVLSDDSMAVKVVWLKEVCAGRLRLVGVNPRTEEDLDRIENREWRSILESATPGVFGYADCHHCHKPQDADEALHSVFHATQDIACIMPLVEQYMKGLK